MKYELHPKSTKIDTFIESIIMHVSQSRSNFVYIHELTYWRGLLHNKIELLAI